MHDRKFTCQVDGERLDVFVARVAEISRSAAARLIDGGSVRVNDAPGARSSRLQAGDRVEVAVVDAAEGIPLSEIPAIPIVFEDRWLMVVDKPAGLVVHPAPGHPSGTLVDALRGRDEPPAGGDDPMRPGIVHRLDAGTTGLLIVAKDEQVHATLIEMMQARAVSRTYRSLLEGDSPTDSFTVDAPVGRSTRDRKRMAVVSNGKDAVTNFFVLERFGPTTYVEVKPVTGRTHQIRVHARAAEMPVVGDPVYGGTKALATLLGLTRPFLHAEALNFAHPVTEEPMELHAELPADLVAALAGATEERTI